MTYKDSDNALFRRNTAAIALIQSVLDLDEETTQFKLEVRGKKYIVIVAKAENSNKSEVFI